MTRKSLFVSLAAACIVGCSEEGSQAASDQCPADQVCLVVWQEGENVSFQLTNNSTNMVTIPEFTGLGSLIGGHSIRLTSDIAAVDAPVSSGGFPVGYVPSDSVLRSNGWVGFTLPAEGVRRVYRLSEGCHNVTVAYQVNAKGEQYYHGQVRGMSQKLCL